MQEDDGRCWSERRIVLLVVCCSRTIYVQYRARILSVSDVFRYVRRVSVMAEGQKQLKDGDRNEKTRQRDELDWKIFGQHTNTIVFQKESFLSCRNMFLKEQRPIWLAFAGLLEVNSFSRGVLFVVSFAEKAPVLE